MHISIATSNGKTINLEVDVADSVHQIKQKIHVLEGIPSEQQKLLCDGKLLEDLQTIAEYNVEKDFLITLKVNEMKLQIKSIGEANFTIEADPTDTIKELKCKIQELKGFSADDFTLSFKGKKLENENATLSSANLKDKSLLLLVKKSSKPNLNSTPSPSVSKYCVNNCGFYGNSVTNDYCSKCFKDLGFLKPEVKTPEANNNNNSNISNNIIDNHVEEVKQVDTSKCWKCSKKVGIYGFQCRCKYYFCDKHRYNDQHNCTFDYAQYQKANLLVKLEKVVDRKVDEI